MDILKYLYEEPAALEALSADLDPDARRRGDPTGPLETLLDTPRYYRGYLAGTDLATGRVGLTALAHPDAFVGPLLDVLAGSRWTHGATTGAVTLLDEAAVRRVLCEPADTAVLIGSEEPVPAEAAAGVIADERRYAIPALCRLLDRTRTVFFPEPAHHGFDWSFFAKRPMRAALTAAFRRHPHDGVRRFVLPYRIARAEHRFYFEAYDLSLFSEYELD